MKKVTTPRPRGRENRQLPATHPSISLWLVAIALVPFAACKMQPQACRPCPTCSTETAAGEPPSRGTGGEPSAVSGAAAMPSGSPTVAGCRVFPPDNPWNQDISNLPVDPELHVPKVTDHMSSGTSIHLDFGTTKDHYGIPITAGRAAPPAPLTFDEGWPDESDKLACPNGGGDFCYPIPLNARIEGGPGAKPGADRHVVFLATDGAPDHCVLYETYNTVPKPGGFLVKSAAIWKLDSNARRPRNWTSADAAGLPILPGLVRYEEVKAGEIRHAIRFTLERTANSYIDPATHAAGVNTDERPPLGVRVRLKASFDTSIFTGAAKVLVTAMKKYGMILADNGGDWFVSGDEHDGWGNMDDFIAQMKKVKGRDFEIVKTGKVIRQN
jgi:hypothetical protein